LHLNVLPANALPFLGEAPAERLRRLQNTRRSADTVGRLRENVRAQEAPPEEKGSADGAEPSQRSISLLDLSGDDSCGGAQAVGNACDALILGQSVYSVSCVYYNVDAAQMLSSLHLLYRVRGDQPRLMLHNATTVASIHHQAHRPNE
jgi:hypothetical protein